MPEELTPLPCPFDRCYEWITALGVTRRFRPELHNGQGPDRSVTLFTADQMQAYALENRRAQPAPSITEHQSKWGRLYTAANALIAAIGFHGRLDTDSPEVKSLQDEADLISCRGSVKTEHHHYERLSMVHGKTPHGECYWAEANRLGDLLDRIDSLASIDAALRQEQPTKGEGA